MLDVPVSFGDAIVFSSREVHKQSTSKEVKAINNMPAPIPRIRTKFECLPFFETLRGVEVGGRNGVASTGDVEA